MQEKLRPLIELSEELEALGVHYEGHSWSIVKLLILGGWSYVYTTIIPHYFKEYWYVDLLAGSGTVRVKETGDIVLGSPFVAHFFARQPFTKYFLVELNRERYNALHARATRVIGPPDRVRVLPYDCNKYIPRLIRSVERGTHFLAFVDNEGLDVYWSTIECLLGADCDILINFPTTGVRRVLGAAREGDESQAEALTRFFGGDLWREAAGEEELLEIYLQQLASRYRELRGKGAYVSSIRVGSRRFYYDIILICKCGPYVRAWEYLKEKLEWRDPNIVRYTLDLLKGRTQRIDWLVGLHDEIERAEREERRRKRREEGRYLPLDKFFAH